VSSDTDSCRTNRLVAAIATVAAAEAAATTVAAAEAATTAAAAAEAATAAAAATTEGATGALFLGTGLIDGEGAAAEVGAVHLLSGDLGLVLGAHGDERETAGAAGRHPIQNPKSALPE
jgi:hypothetical protein